MPPNRRHALLVLGLCSTLGCRALNADPWRWARPMTAEELDRSQAWGHKFVSKQLELRISFLRGVNDLWYAAVDHKHVFWIRDANGGTKLDFELPLPADVEIEQASVRVIWPGRVPLLLGPEVVSVEAGPAGGAPRVLRLRLPAHPAGTVVQAHLSMRAPRLGVWTWQELEASTPIEDYLLEVRTDPQVEAELLLYNPPKEVVVEHPREAKKNVARLRARNLPARITEELGPDAKLLGPWWTLRIAQGLTNRLEQKGLDLWYWAFVSQTQGLEKEIGPHLPRLEAEPNLDGCGDLLCQVDRALVWLESEELPKPPEASAAKELRAAGDGQALPRARLLWAALRRAGLPVRWALAAPRGSATFDPNKPSPVAVSHPLLYLPANGEAPPLWIDPGCVYCRPGEVAEQFVGTLAVIGWGRGGPTPFTLTQVKANLPTPSQRTIRWQIQLDATKNPVEVEVELAGRIRQEVSAKQLKLDQATSAQGVASWIKERSPGATCSEIQPFPKSDAEPVRHLRCALPKLVRREGSRWQVPLEVFSSRWDGALLAERRRTPVEVRHSELEVEVITLHLPPGLQVISSPKPRRLSGELFDVELKVQKIGDTLELRRTVRAQRGRVGADRYTQEKAILEEARALRGAEVILAPAGT